MSKFPIGLLAAVLMSVTAWADDAQPPAQSSEQPQPARQWLELQRSGKAASSHPQPLSGAAMSKVHERYIKSFSNPIPANYEHAQSTAGK